MTGSEVMKWTSRTALKTGGAAIASEHSLDITTRAGGNVGSGPRSRAELVDRQRALGAFAPAWAGVRGLAA